MQYRKLGQTDIAASVVGFGGWALGGNFWGGADKQESLQAVHAALDAGITLFDTAPAYGVGQSEEWMGEGLEGQREDIVLVSKCGLVWHVEIGEYRFTYEGKNVHRFLGPDSIRHEIGESLRRLRTDYLDCYIVHAPDALTPIPEVVEVLEDLEEAGMIRSWGISNMSVEQAQEYERAGALSVCQDRFNMLDQTHREGMLAFCLEHEVSYMAYSPMAQGLLTGKVTLDRQFRENDQRPEMDLFSGENRQKVLNLLDEIRPVSEAHDISLADLALAWTFHQPGITFVLAGIRNAEQARENAQAGAVVLSPEELKHMDDAIAKHWTPLD